MKTKIGNLIICCPQRWWFRWGVYIVILFTIINPYLRDSIWGGLPLLAFYIVRMPSLCIYDDGIEISIWKYKRFIEWNKIRKVWLTPKQIVISEGFILLPIVIFSFRKDFYVTQDVLEAKLGEKAKRYSFPLPL